MVRAVLKGRKTQTRRVVTPQSQSNSAGLTHYKGCLVFEHDIEAIEKFCPYGQPGDRLWVRENFYCDYGTFAAGGSLPKERPEWADQNLYYAADGTCCEQIPECCCAEVGKPRWRPSIHMPRWASRINLEITGVRVERLQDISRADTEAEGVGCDWQPDSNQFATFQRLWDSINGKAKPGKPDVSWRANPWVWVLELKVLGSTANQD